MAGPRYVNPYSTMTPLGQAMQNIAQSMFANATRGGGQERDYTAQDAAHFAQADKLAAETAAKMYETQRARRYDEELGPNIAASVGIDQSAGPPQVTPGQQQDAARLRMWHGMGAGDGRSTAYDVARAFDVGTEGLKRADMLRGAGTAPQVAAVQGAMKGDPTQDVEGDMVVPRYGGAVQATPLGRAKIGAEGALAGQRSAQAALTNAKRLDPGKYRSSIDALVESFIGFNPEGIPQFAKTPVVPGQPYQKAPQESREVTPADMNAMSTLLDGFLGIVRQQDGTLAETSELDLDQHSRAKIISMASAAKKRGIDIPTAVQEALRQAGGLDTTYVERSTIFGIPYGDRTPTKRGIPNSRTAAGSILPAQPQKPPAPPTVVQTPGVPPPAQRVVGQKYQTPKGLMIWTGTGWTPAGT